MTAVHLHNCSGHSDRKGMWATATHMFEVQRMTDRVSANGVSWRLTDHRPGHTQYRWYPTLGQARDWIQGQEADS